MTPAIAIQADWGKVDVKPHISVAKLVPILRTTGGCSDSVLGKLLKAPKDRLGALKPFGIGRYDMSNKSINKLLVRYPSTALDFARAILRKAQEKC
jgi:hypothetical protein